MRPMTTAPRDGSQMWLCVPELHEPDEALVGRWAENGWAVLTDQGEVIIREDAPTGWVPVRK